MSSFNTRSRILTFAAGFMAATTLSGIVLSFPGLRAAVGMPQGLQKFGAMQIYQLTNGAFDLNKNGVDDYAEIIIMENGDEVRSLFSGVYGWGMPFFCVLNSVECNVAVTAEMQLDAEELVKIMPEICTNGRDDDGDARIDCGDPQCDVHPSCQPTVAASETSCNNNNDDDGDGNMDCSDGDCATDLICIARSAAVNAATQAVTDTAPMQQPTVNIDTQVIVPATTTVDPTPVMNAAAPVMPVTNTIIPAADTVVPVMPSSPASTNSDQSTSAGATELPPMPTDGYSYVLEFREDLCPNPSFSFMFEGFQNCWTWVRVVAPTTGSNTSAITNPTTTTTTPTTGSDSSMHGAGSAICSNGSDDDGDRKTDMLDSDCLCSSGQMESGCVSVECSNGDDDDGDRLIDEMDPGCAGYLSE